MAKKPFVALNGAEIKTMVLLEVDGLVNDLPGLTLVAKGEIYKRIVKEFDGDTRFEYHITYPQVRWQPVIEVNGAGGWRFTQRFEVFPGEPATWDVVVVGGNWTDTTGTQAIGAAKEDLRRYQAKVTSPEPIHEAPDSQDSSAVDGQVSHQVPTGDDMRSNRLDPSQMVTHTGEEINVKTEDMGEGWAPPEDRDAIAQEQAAATRHNARLERQMRDEAAAITTVVGDMTIVDTPNAARREHGMPIPAPQKTGDGTVVDVLPGEGQIF